MCSVLQPKDLNVPDGTGGIDDPGELGDVTAAVGDVIPCSDVMDEVILAAEEALSSPRNIPKRGYKFHRYIITSILNRKESAIFLVK